MNNSYVILFDLGLLIAENNEPNPATCTVYSMLAMQSNLVGHAITEGKLEDPIPYVDLIADQPESERERIMAWLEFNEIMKPRALRLSEDAIGTDKVLAVFDGDKKRVEMWRELGAVCFDLAAASAPEIALAR